MRCNAAQHGRIGHACYMKYRQQRLVRHVCPLPRTCLPSPTTSHARAAPACTRMLLQDTRTCMCRYVCTHTHIHHPRDPLQAPTCQDQQSHKGQSDGNCRPHRPWGWLQPVGMGGKREGHLEPHWGGETAPIPTVPPAGAPFPSPSNSMPCQDPHNQPSNPTETPTLPGPHSCPLPSLQGSDQAPALWEPTPQISPCTGGAAKPPPKPPCPPSSSPGLPSLPPPSSSPGPPRLLPPASVQDPSLCSSSSNPGPPSASAPAPAAAQDPPPSPAHLLQAGRKQWLQPCSHAL